MCRIDGRRRTEDGGLTSVSRLPSSVVVVVLLLALTTGCISKDSFQVMAQQPRFEPLENNDAAPDQASARAPEPDTVARGQLRDDALLYTGKIAGADANVFPFAVTREVLARGQERFSIYCTPCHDQLGTGNGMVVRAGFARPPSLHEQRLRAAPVGHFFDVITNGLRTMPPYASQIAARDRWAIIAYIRALQLSQNATINDVPPDQRDKIGAPPR